MPLRPDRRPDLTAALERLLRSMTQHHDFGVDVGSVVVVALAAHGEAAASVRALQGCARSVVVDGRARSVELGLRPPFFRAGDAPARLATLCHELLHLEGDGLREANRHATRSHASLEDEARDVARGLIDVVDAKDVLCLAHDGEVALRAWTHRPTEQTKQRAFDDADVHDAVVAMITPPDRRGGWW